MIYEPITEESKEDWVNWLEEQAAHLNGKQQTVVTRELLDTEEGDLANMKDLVRNLS